MVGGCRVGVTPFTMIAQQVDRHIRQGTQARGPKLTVTGLAKYVDVRNDGPIQAESYRGN